MDDKITNKLRQADLLFGLKPALAKFGFPETEDLFIVFKSKNKEYKTGAITSVTSGRTSSLNSQDIKAAVADWINKAEAQEQFHELLDEELGTPKGENSELEIKLVSGSSEFALRGIWRCPCVPGATSCCWVF